MCGEIGARSICIWSTNTMWGRKENCDTNSRTRTRSWLTPAVWHRAVMVSGHRVAHCWGRRPRNWKVSAHLSVTNTQRTILLYLWHSPVVIVNRLLSRVHDHFILWPGEGLYFILQNEHFAVTRKQRNYTNIASIRSFRKDTIPAFKEINHFLSLTSLYKKTTDIYNTK